jgi:hypothetical protein
MSAHRRLVLLTVAFAAGATTPAAGAAKQPLPSSESGNAGVVAAGGSGTERLLARPAGRDTQVLAVRRGSGEILRSRRIRGRWSVPAVTLHNGTTGLSTDGRTLVLTRPARDFPPATTTLAVLDARQLVVQRTIALRGFFTVDAISPDGRSLYVIQYAGDNVLDYRVRTLDTSTGRLAARDVVDPRKPDEQMGGLPTTRATTRDGRWVYTLYGGGDETFIHALDTVGRTAACIDLGMLPADADLSGVRLHLSPDGRQVAVRDGGELVATVDARTFAVHEPGAAAAAPGRGFAPAADGSGLPWPVLLLAAAGGLLGMTVMLGRRSWLRRTRMRPQAPGA